MNHKKIICTILSFLVIALLFPAVRTDAAKRTTTVSYARTGEKTTSMTVTVTGPGVLVDGDTEIKPGSGSVEYNLPPGTMKDFVIKPDSGYKLVSLTYKELDTGIEKDITDQVGADGKFTIEVKDQKIELSAKFEKIDDGTGGPGGTGSSGGSSSTNKPSTSKPSTGSSSTGTSSGNKTQTSTSSTSSTKTGDSALIGLYLIIMLVAAVLIVYMAKKRKDVYRKP